MQYRCILTILFGLFVIWTGLLRSVEAQEFKPNAFWFCMATGLIAIAGGFMYRVEKRKSAALLAMVSAVTVLAFYLWCFTTQPEKDANYRVAMAIIAAIAEVCVVLVPREAIGSSQASDQSKR